MLPSGTYFLAADSQYLGDSWLKLSGQCLDTQDRGKLPYLRDELLQTGLLIQFCWTLHMRAPHHSM